MFPNLTSQSGSTFSDRILSVTVVNKLVPKDVSICYREHMLQQAGYQRCSALVAARMLPQTHAFRSTSRYFYLKSLLSVETFLMSASC
jgi:hypothetical protein